MIVLVEYRREVLLLLISSENVNDSSGGVGPLAILASVIRRQAHGFSLLPLSMTRLIPLFCGFGLHAQRGLRYLL